MKGNWLKKQNVNWAILTLHGFIEYLKYKWKAKGRHGIHSPFVYAFIEDVLQDRKKALKECEHYAGYEWLGTHYARLLDHIIVKYNYKNLLLIPPDYERKTSSLYEMLLFNAAEPGKWINLFNKYSHLFKNDSAVLVFNIHKTREHTSGWETLCTHPKVLMSIDLYGVGLLFFKEEFKEKQHFVLKY